MLIIDFVKSKADILSVISKRDHPSWTIPLFDFIRMWLDESVTDFPIQTSGSTGTPKLIRHSRPAMMASAERTCDFFDLKRGDVVLLALPATYIGGKMMIVRSMMRGMKLICTEPRSNPLTSFDFNSEIDFAAFTPMQMSMIMDDAKSNTTLSQIKKIILGGGEVSYPLRQRLQAIQPSVYETYGMTETVSHIALKKINGDDRSDYFTILDGVKITTDDRGCLVIDAPKLSSDSVITNDIVKLISQKEFQWLGRYDNIINTGGIKVNAEEIERKLQPYVDLHFFITGIPDEVLGQRVVMIAETSKSAADVQHLYNEALHVYLGKFEKPREILTMEQFSYTENGKVNKKETLARVIR